MLLFHGNHPLDNSPRGSRQCSTFCKPRRSGHTFAWQFDPYTNGNMHRKKLQFRLLTPLLSSTFEGSQACANFLYVCFKPSRVISSNETPRIAAASSSFICFKLWVNNIGIARTQRCLQTRNISMRINLNSFTRHTLRSVFVR